MLSRTEVTWCSHPSQQDVLSHGNKSVRGFPDPIAWLSAGALNTKTESGRVSSWDHVLETLKNQYPDLGTLETHLSFL